MGYVIFYALILLNLGSIFGDKFFIIIIGITLPIIINIMKRKYNKKDNAKNKYQIIINFLDIKIKKSSLFSILLIATLIDTVIVESMANINDSMITQIIMIGCLTQIMYSMLRNTFLKHSSQKEYYHNILRNLKVKEGKVIYLSGKLKESELQKKMDILIFRIVVVIYILSAITATISIEVGYFGMDFFRVMVIAVVLLRIVLKFSEGDNLEFKFNKNNRKLS